MRASIMRSDVFSPSCLPDPIDDDGIKYSNRQYGLGYKGNDKGQVNRNDDSRDWDKSDVKQTGLVDREPL